MSMENNMNSQRRLQAFKDRVEDVFIDISESAIKKGLSFADAMKQANHPEYLGDDGIYNVWEERYNKWQGYAVRPQYFSLESERQAVKARRKQEAEAAVNEAFYQSNRSMLIQCAEAKKSFEQTHLPADMKQHYQRAYAEVWGKHEPMPEGDPAQVGFLAGFNEY